MCFGEKASAFECCIMDWNAEQNCGVDIAYGGRSCTAFPALAEYAHAVWKMISVSTTEPPPPENAFKNKQEPCIWLVLSLVFGVEEQRLWGHVTAWTFRAKSYRPTGLKFSTDSQTWWPKAHCTTQPKGNTVCYCAKVWNEEQKWFQTWKLSEEGMTRSLNALHAVWLHNYEFPVSSNTQNVWQNLPCSTPICDKTDLNVAYLKHITHHELQSLQQ